MRLVDEVHQLLNASPEVASMLGLRPFKNIAELLGPMFGSFSNNPAIGKIFFETYSADQDLVKLLDYEISETARRNFEPGGEAATLLFSHGAQAVIAHRVAHKLWSEGNFNPALAVKATCGRAFNTDIHPAAKIGAGLWLDHGLGFVVGETSVIEEDVSIWHNVTLGSTLNDSGPTRHPHIGRGTVIGAGAILLGHIRIGQNANIAAGAIVLEDVEDGFLFIGHKARRHGQARVNFANSEKSQ